MAASRKGDLSASMAILGLLVRQPDTAGGIARRLAEDFRGCWSRTVAYNDLRSLAERGRVRLVRKGTAHSPDRYEATPLGRDEFLAWLRGSFELPAVLREVVRARLILSDDADLPLVLQAMREQEEACWRECEAAQVRLNQARREGLLGPVDSTDIKDRVRSAIMTDEVTLWNQMGKRLQRIRLYIEGDDEELETTGTEDG